MQAIMNLMRDPLLDAELMSGDETEVQVLKESGRTARSKSCLWAQMGGTGPPIQVVHLCIPAQREGGTDLVLGRPERLERRNH
jgi:hypothetical protein